ncbi:Uncharacterised protein [Yersinia wautersii]|uniref:Transposase n=1 Tax=Yersinia wautersii TaxID=1341643 RepID=A0ABP1ZCA3_9GAMM|nr:Uncharacterised protein [Yersinia wautersii]
MSMLPAGTRIWIVAGVTDMRVTTGRVDVVR